MTKTNSLEQIVDFDSLTQEVRGVQDNFTFRLLKTSLYKVATNYYHSENGSEAKELVLDESKAKKLAKTLWDVAAEHIAINYLKLNKDKIELLKDQKDPASGKPQWEAFIREHLGIDENGIYDAIKNRGVVRPEEIDALINPIYGAHANTATTKMITSKIDSLEKAQALLAYLKDLKKENPKTYEGVTVPSVIKSVQEAQGIYASVIPLLSKDYKPKMEDTYKKAA